MNSEPPITEADVRAALAELRRDADTSSRTPSVLALARRLGIPNTTLRRRFPGVCAELAAARGQRAPATRTSGVDAPTHATAYGALLAANARLRAANHQLTEHLGLAIANIQRLSLDNHKLRQALHEAHKIVPMPSGRARPSSR